MTNNFTDVERRGLAKKRSRLKLIEEFMNTLWEVLPSKSETHSEQLGWSPNFFEETAGAWQGEELVRPDQGDYEIRLELY